ncbi:hypothetical protein LXL04_032938 [Taraxacum kok-saghyz]
MYISSVQVEVDIWAITRLGRACHMDAEQRRDSGHHTISERRNLEKKMRDYDCQSPQPTSPIKMREKKFFFFLNRTITLKLAKLAPPKAKSHYNQFSKVTFLPNLDLVFHHKKAVFFTSKANEIMLEMILLKQILFLLFQRIQKKALTNTSIFDLTSNEHCKQLFRFGSKGCQVESCAMSNLAVEHLKNKCSTDSVANVRGQVYSSNLQVISCGKLVPIPAVPVVVKRQKLVNVNTFISKISIQIANDPPSTIPPMNSEIVSKASVRTIKGHYDFFPKTFVPGSESPPPFTQEGKVRSFKASNV